MAISPEAIAQFQNLLKANGNELREQIQADAAEQAKKTQQQLQQLTDQIKTDQAEFAKKQDEKVGAAIDALNDQLQKQIGELWAAMDSRSAATSTGSGAESLGCVSAPEIRPNSCMISF